VEDNKDVDGPVLMDVASVYSYSDTKGGLHRAPAGSERGLIPNVKTFASNLLSPARKTEADNLANKGVNIVGSHPVFGPVVWGAATRALANSAFDAIHVRRMLIDLSQTVMPIFQSTLFDPVDPTTWRLAYGKVKPILQNLEAERAIYPGWQYIGDQEASTITDAKFNKKEDLAVGLYKAKVPMVPVGYTKEIDFTVQVNNLLSLYQTQAQ
jgi:phage tail sheath protein FI